MNLKGEDAIGNSEQIKEEIKRRIKAKDEERSPGCPMMLMVCLYKIESE